MSLTAIQSNNSKIGTCPHGLPQGACPICSGMSGGMKKTDFSAKPGEMSWNECAAIGAFLKAQKMPDFNGSKMPKILQTILRRSKIH